MSDYSVGGGHAILSFYYLLVYILKQCLLVSRLVSNSWTQMILPPESTGEYEHRPPQLNSLAGAQARICLPFMPDSNTVSFQVPV